MNSEHDKPSIGPGCRVRMHYTLSLEDGTEVDSTRDDEPLDFVLGDGSLVYGLEQALLGFRAGDVQCLFIEPQEGFGARDEDNVHVLARAEFAPELALEEGSIVAFEAPNGEALPGTIVELGESEVRVDFNHPLAGRRLIFDISILEVQASGGE